MQFFSMASWLWRHGRGGHILLALYVLHACLGGKPQGLCSASGSARLEGRSERPSVFRAGMEASAEDGHVLFDSGSGDGDGDGDDNDDDDNGGGGDDDDDDDDDDDGDGDGDGDTVDDTVVILPGGDRDLQTQRLKAERERSWVVHAGRRFGHMPLLVLPLKLRGGASSVGDDDDDGHGMHWPETARGKQGQAGSRKGPKLGRVEDNGPRHDPTHRKDDMRQVRSKDSKDRATVEQVMDPRTRAALQRLINNFFLLAINGCLSTGKEANVYHAVANSSHPYCADKPSEPTQLLQPLGPLADDELQLGCPSFGTFSHAAETQDLAADLDDVSLDHSLAAQGQERQERQANVECSSGKETWEETGEESSLESSMLSKDGTTGCCERQGIFWGKSDASEIEVAIKVFKTSILVFKDREKYVAGDYRFRHGYSKKPQKMVQMWAEKEFRNLKRIFQAGIRCPRPLMIRMHILVMEFVGSLGVPAPKLREADLDLQGWHTCFNECFLLLRALFHRCSLVHGDLSEYNLLFHQGHVTVIDVSQAVQPDHPLALEFLRRDINNIVNFFHRKGVAIPGLRDMFEAVVKFPSDDETAMQMLSKSVERRRLYSSGKAVGGNDPEADDAVFMSSHIPQALGELEDPEYESRRLAEGHASGGFDTYALMTGMDVEAARLSAVSAKEIELQAMMQGDRAPVGKQQSTSFGLKASDMLASMGLDAFGMPLVRTQDACNDPGALDEQVADEEHVQVGWDEWDSPPCTVAKGQIKVENDKIHHETFDRFASSQDPLDTQELSQGSSACNDDPVQDRNVGGEEESVGDDSLVQGTKDEGLSGNSGLCQGVEEVEEETEGSQRVSVDSVTACEQVSTEGEEAGEEFDDDGERMRKVIDPTLVKKQSMSKVEWKKQVKLEKANARAVKMKKKVKKKLVAKTTTRKH